MANGFNISIQQNQTDVVANVEAVCPGLKKQKHVIKAILENLLWGSLTLTTTTFNFYNISHLTCMFRVLMREKNWRTVTFLWKSNKHLLTCNPWKSQDLNLGHSCERWVANHYTTYATYRTLWYNVEKLNLMSYCVHN